MRAVEVVTLSTLMLFGCGRTASKPQPARAATPEEAVKKLESAFRNGSIEEYSAVMVKPYREAYAKLRAAIRESQEASEAVADVLDARFGRGSGIRTPKSTPDYLPSDSTTVIEILDSKVEGPDRVQMRIQSTVGPRHDRKAHESVVIAVKEEDGWKLQVGDVYWERGTAMFEKSTKVDREFAAQVKAGKFRDLREAMRAYSEAMKSAGK